MDWIYTSLFWTPKALCIEYIICSLYIHTGTKVDKLDKHWRLQSANSKA